MSHAKKATDFFGRTRGEAQNGPGNLLFETERVKSGGGADYISLLGSSQNCFLTISAQILIPQNVRFAKRAVKRAYEPQTPLSSWYLDPESGGRCPLMDQRGS